tara:strand:- start:187 stop:480 length:294 start_codon:yes stop_codon:yes gene_type:complete
MAKTKEKIVDLKPKAEKITEKQLETVQKVINGINRGQLEMGSLEVKKHEMLHGISTLRDELAKLQSDFQKEYGTTDINIQDGTINYPKENGEADKKD